MSTRQKISTLPLTVRQRQALEFIRKCLRLRGYGPTVRELAEGMGVHSPNGVMGHLNALERKGFIKRQANLSRSIILTEAAFPRKEGLPVTALLENGRLVENPDPHEVVNVHEQMSIDGLEFSWIRIQNDCVLNDLHLKKDDLFLIRRSRSASEGESVVIRGFGKEFLLAKCQIDEVTGKTVLRTAGRQFENSSSTVFGIVVSVIRLFF